LLTDDPAWFTASRAVEGGKNILLRNGGACWPFRIRKRFGLTILESAGQNTRSVAGPLTFSLVESAYSTERNPLPRLTAKDLPSPVDLVDLRRLPKECLPSLFPDVPGRAERPDTLWFSRSLGPTAEDFLASLASSTRKEYKYSANRVRRTFGAQNIRYQKIRLTKEFFDETWAKATAIAPYTWQGKSGVSVLVSRAKKRFLEELAGGAMPVFTHLYHLGDTLAAVAVSMELSGQCLIYAHEYNALLSKFRPGALIDLELITRAMEDGARVLDFGIGDTPNKRMIRCVPVPLWRVRVPLTVRGRLAVAAGYAGSLAARMIRKVGDVGR